MDPEFETGGVLGTHFITGIKAPKPGVEQKKRERTSPNDLDSFGCIPIQDSIP